MLSKAFSRHQIILVLLMRLELLLRTNSLAGYVHLMCLCNRSFWQGHWIANWISKSPSKATGTNVIRLISTFLPTFLSLSTSVLYPSFHVVTVCSQQWSLTVPEIAMDTILSWSLWWSYAWKKCCTLYSILPFYQKIDSWHFSTNGTQNSNYSISTLFFSFSIHAGV